MKKPWMILLLTLLCLGCTRQQTHYVIGVSQCSDDIWREKQNAELRMGTYFNDGIELHFAAAYDNDERQIQQIDSLVKTGIDLLIVAPNQIQTISPAIDRAYDSGIPVIVFERKTNSKKYTSYIGADNYEMGRVMGEHIASRLHGHGRVMEIMGLKGSSPAIERHKGFTEAISQYPGIEVVATLQGDWTEESGYNSPLLTTPLGEEQIDFVFAQNDRMAMGARRAIMERRRISSPKGGTGGALPRFCGIDGLPGEGGGIQLVRDSLLDATYIYPTHGDQLINQAIQILSGQPYQKEVLLKSALVTSENANALLMQSEETLRQTAYLDQLHEKADSYMQELDTQRTITMLAVGVIVLLVAAIILTYLYYIGRNTLHRERVVNSLWNLKPEDVIPSTAPTDQAVATAEQSAEPTTSLFITRFKEVVEKRLDESELSVEDLASDMNLSRVQLYRKVKAVTGSTPVELLRTARLNRSYQLLVTTDKSVSEVAYQVGFTAPSYFTKCFKEEYGMLPGDLRKN